MSPKKRSWILPLVLIALFGYMAVQIFSLNSAAPKSEYRTIIDYFRNEQVAEYELDFGTGELTILLNDEKRPPSPTMCQTSACSCRIPMSW